MVTQPLLLFNTTTHQEFIDKGIMVNEMQIMPYGSMFAFYNQDGNTFLIREAK